MRMIPSDQGKPPGNKPLVICLGSVVADHTFWVSEIPQPPSKSTARAYSTSAGGLAGNASIAVARLGGRCAFWGRIGNDLAGQPLAAALAEEGVDISGLRRVEGGRTPISAVLVDRMGDRSIFAYRGEGLGRETDWLPLSRLPQASALLVDPRWPEGALAALEAARAAGVPSVLDGERTEARILIELVPRVDHAIFSVPGLQNFAPGLRPIDGLRRALTTGPQLVALTRGEDGVMWLTRDDPQPREMPAFLVEATNTSGAGDVFHGAYALAIAEGMEIPQAMRFASAAGALRARDGATPTRAMVEEMLLTAGAPVRG
jgi:sulfofructose kinase